MELGVVSKVQAWHQMHIYSMLGHFAYVATSLLVNSDCFIVLGLAFSKSYAKSDTLLQAHLGLNDGQLRQFKAWSKAARRVSQRYCRACHMQGDSSQCCVLHHLAQAVMIRGLSLGTISSV